MYFVTKIEQHGRRTTERNVRLGGYKGRSSALNAAKRNAPAIVRENGRKIIGQTINRDFPDYIE